MKPDLLPLDVRVKVSEQKCRFSHKIFAQNSTRNKIHVYEHVHTKDFSACIFSASPRLNLTLFAVWTDLKTSDLLTVACNGCFGLRSELERWRAEGERGGGGTEGGGRAEGRG